LELSQNKIRELSKEITSRIEAEKYSEALEKLTPILDKKVKFYKLDKLGLELGRNNLKEKEKFFRFLDYVIDYDAMGGYVIASKSMITFLDDDLDTVMKKSREYILKGNVWHVCDNISERSIGQGLVDHFEETLPWLDKFLSSGEPWLQRSTGVAIHFYIKRVRDDPERADKLLGLIEPYLEVKSNDAVKGLGWGLKTMGRYYPDVQIPFLRKIRKSGKVVSGIIWRKALTYLDENEKAEIMAE
jgi:hypothetical protein